MQASPTENSILHLTLDQLDHALAKAIDAVADAARTPMEEIEPKIQAVVQKIFREGNARGVKQFIKWSGDRNIRNTQEAIQFLKGSYAHLQPIDWQQLKSRMVAPEALQAGNAKMLMRANTGFDSPASFIAKHLPHFIGFNEPLLRNFFRKSFQKLVAIHSLTKSLELEKNKLGNNEAGRANFEELQLNLKLWAMHYLFRGAKPPVLHQAGEWHLSFTEYLDDNHAAYYRGDGGAVHAHFLKYLSEAGGYSFLAEGFEEGCIGIVTVAKFEELMRRLSVHSSTDNSFIYTPIQTLSDLEHKPEYCILDVTSLLHASLKPSELADTIKDIKSHLVKLPQKILAGGVIDMGNTVGVYLFFTEDKWTGDLLSSFKNYQGALGAYPDTMNMRRQLIEMGFDLKTLIKSYPFRDETFDNDILNRLRRFATTPLTGQDILKGFSRIGGELEDLFSLSKSGCTNLTAVYCPLVKNLLAMISYGEPTCPEAPLDPLFECLDKISKRVRRIADLEKSGDRPELKFQKISQQYHLIIQEVLFLLIFLRPRSLEKSFKQVLNAFPFAPSEGSGLNKLSWAYTSGMAGYEAIFQACEDTLKKPAGQKIKTTVLQGSYFEVVEDRMLKGYLQRAFEITVVPLRDMRSPDFCEVICLDLYPNYVPMKNVEVTPVIDVVKTVLASRDQKTELTPPAPLIVILDTSTTVFWSEAVSGLIAQLTSEIEKKRVAVILVSSLAKMATGGFDYFQGGVAQCYFQAHGALTAKLEESSARNPLPPEASAFFSLLLQSNLESIKLYLNKIVENTDRVYMGLQKAGLQKSESPIFLGERTTPIPILGFHFDFFLDMMLKKVPPKKTASAQQAPPTVNEELQMKKASSEADRANFIYLIHYYIAEKARRRGLPLIIRPSFGFPHAAVTECRTALRMTLGVEDPPIVEAYLEILMDLQKELTALMSDTSSQTAQFLAQLIHYEEGDGDEIRNFFERKEAAILQLLPQMDLKGLIAQFHALKR